MCCQKNFNFIHIFFLFLSIPLLLAVLRYIDVAHSLYDNQGMHHQYVEPLKRTFSSKWLHQFWNRYFVCLLVLTVHLILTWVLLFFIYRLSFCTQVLHSFSKTLGLVLFQMLNVLTHCVYFLLNLFHLSSYHFRFQKRVIGESFSFSFEIYFKNNSVEGKRLRVFDSFHS